MGELLDTFGYDTTSIGNDQTFPQGSPAAEYFNTGTQVPVFSTVAPEATPIRGVIEGGNFNPNPTKDVSYSPAILPDFYYPPVIGPGMSSPIAPSVFSAPGTSLNTSVADLLIRAQTSPTPIEVPAVSEPVATPAATEIPKLTLEDSSLLRPHTRFPLEASQAIEAGSSSTGKPVTSFGTIKFASVHELGKPTTSEYNLTTERAASFVDALQIKGTVVQRDPFVLKGLADANMVDALKPELIDRLETLKLQDPYAFQRMSSTGKNLLVTGASKNLDASPSTELDMLRGVSKDIDSALENSATVQGALHRSYSAATSAARLVSDVDPIKADPRLMTRIQDAEGYLAEAKALEKTDPVQAQRIYEDARAEYQAAYAGSKSVTDAGYFKNKLADGSETWNSGNVAAILTLVGGSLLNAMLTHQSNKEQQDFQEKQLERQRAWQVEDRNFGAAQQIAYAEAARTPRASSGTRPSTAANFKGAKFTV